MSWSRTYNKWVATARFDYKRIFLGHFTDEDEAAAAVEAFWREKAPLPARL